MLAFSVFLGDEFDQDKVRYIRNMKENGFSNIFTSLHIPEENSSRVLENLLLLGKLSQDMHLNIMADISNECLENIGIDFHDITSINKLKKFGVNGIRMDYGIDVNTIANVSKSIKVGLNASTLTDSMVLQLIDYKANFSNIELWHNYYPRPDTGLSEQYFTEINKKWLDLGVKIIAFVPGDMNFRGPLHKGLPTLESHRSQHPLLSAVQLIEKYSCQGICIGDEGLSARKRKQFHSYFKEKKVLLEVNICDKTHSDLFLGIHTSRQDEARDVIRSQEARFKNIPKIKPSKKHFRLKGSVTIDNEKYLRYMGELQILKKNLPTDDKVNVVAHVVAQDQDLIECILPNYQFEILESRNDDD